jgi:hypothetical protein
MSFSVMLGKGARGRYNHLVTLKGRAAEPVARMLCASAPAGYRAKFEPKV